MLALVTAYGLSMMRMGRAISDKAEAFFPFQKAMANATNRAESFLEWIQGMIMRYESGRIPSTKFIQEVIERTVSIQHPLLGIGKFFVLR